MVSTSGTTLDERRTAQHPIARKRVNSPAKASSTFVDSLPFSLNGRLKGLKFSSVDIASATYTFTLYDKDNVVIYTQSSIAENTFVYTNLTADNVLFLSHVAAYCRWTWTGAEIRTVGDFSVEFFYG